MDIFLILFTVIGLSLFEIITSIDNAIINAEVLTTMSQKARKFFLFWGILFAVFIVRGLLPWLIVWITVPGLGPISALTSTFSNDPRIAEAIEKASPILLIGGGTFLLFLFFHWLFIQPKNYGLIGERFFHSQGVWFFAVASVFLSVIVWLTINIDPLLAFGAVLGSTAFFITHGFREHAEKSEINLLNKKNNMSDISKILYLEVIDATFSIDGVIGAFAFTFSVPLIFFGNGLGAIALRYLTVRNIDNLKNYRYLKNGAMYSLLFLGTTMTLEGFGMHIPSWIAPFSTIIIVGYFFRKSKIELNKIIEAK